MALTMSIKAYINKQKALSKVRSDELWKFGANEWWKDITPYTPMVTGTTAETVKIRPKEIEYYSPQAHYLYRGELMVDPVTGSSYARQGAKKVYTGTPLVISKEKHSLASKEWDKAAEPTQKPKLIRAMQKYIDSGRLNLNE